VVYACEATNRQPEAGQPSGAIRLDHDAADVAGASGASIPTTCTSSPSADEEGAVAAVEATAVKDQGLAAVIERRPLDRLLIEVKLGNAIGEPVEQFEAAGVGTIHCSGRNGGSPTPAARRAPAFARCGCPPVIQLRASRLTVRQVFRKRGGRITSFPTT
jgi:hypothetical protein